ncbi:MAG: hypothetical protein IRZ26_01980 [Clostridia bacterium]|nr:hypothetical protein [Clostridia bacterium]
MGTAPTGWQNPKANWGSADVVGPQDFNRIEGDISAIETGSRTVDPTQAPTGNSGSLRQLLDWFANRIKAITGAANWYDAPAATIAQLTGAVVPRGVIVMWSGAVNAIPAGWALCDGTNGTPDLRDRFIVGAGASYAVGTTGGAAQVTPSGSITVQGHALTVDEMPTHSHQVIGGIYNATEATGRPLMTAAWGSDSTGTTGSAGSGQPHTHGATFAGNQQDNRPPYYALCFIMKL